MYTWEIKEYIKVRDFILTSEEILKVTDSKENPQIRHVKFDPYNENYYVHTEEKDNNGNTFEDNYNFRAHEYNYMRVGKDIVLRDLVDNQKRNTKVLVKKYIKDLKSKVCVDIIILYFFDGLVAKW